MSVYVRAWVCGGRREKFTYVCIYVRVTRYEVGMIDRNFEVGDVTLAVCMYGRMDGCMRCIGR